MGGWRNTLSAIARQQEHASDRATRADPRVIPGKNYHWTIRRQGRVLAGLVDGQPFLTLERSGIRCAARRTATSRSPGGSRRCTSTT